MVLLFISFQESHVVLCYCDLMISFQKTLEAKAKEETADESFPVTIGINAFRGFMDDFVRKKKSGELPPIKKEKKEKKKKDKDKDVYVSTIVYVCAAKQTCVGSVSVVEGIGLFSLHTH